MLVNKNAFEMLLQAWWGFFDEKGVTAQEIIDLANDEAKMGRPNWEHDRDVFYRWIALRVSLDNLGRIKIRDGCDLEGILGEVKNKVIYGFFIEREGSSLWRIVKQELEQITNDERDQFLAERKEAGFKIDPATAEVYQSWGNPFDPYEIFGNDLAPECRDCGSIKLYWARSPGSDVFVEFGDLPDETMVALRKLLETGRKSLKLYSPWVEVANVGVIQTVTTPSGAQTDVSTRD